MREYIDDNLRVIKKHFIKRRSIVSKLNQLSIVEEYKEWGGESIPERDLIWTLPDLTIDERLKNFCRSIKKELK